MAKKHPVISSKPTKTVPITNTSNKNTKILFSYEYLDLQNSKYSFESLSDFRIVSQFHKDLYKKIQEYCSIENFKKNMSNKVWSKTNHIHPIDWSDPQIRESCFTSLESKLMEQVKEECWQLGINNNGFRIHGFFIENVFYVVWLDPLHQLYKRK